MSGLKKSGDGDRRRRRRRGKGEGEGDETGVSETYNMSTYGRQTTVVIDELNLLNV